MNNHKREPNKNQEATRNVPNLGVNNSTAHVAQRVSSTPVNTKSIAAMQKCQQLLPAESHNPTAACSMQVYLAKGSQAPVHRLRGRFLSS